MTSGQSFILGISAFYHDSSAAVVRNGEVIAAAAEERFSRIKHDRSFPSGAIDYCLEASGIDSINDLDAIVFYEKPTAKIIRILENFLDQWPKNSSTFINDFPEYLSNKLNVRALIRKELPGFKGKILFSPHHLSHAAQAFYGSSFEDAAFLVMDAVGESHTTSIGVATRTGKIECLQTIHYPDSLGLLYSTMTAYLGFEVNEGEWKVMGLAAYGEPRFTDKIRELIIVNEDKSFGLNLKAFSFQHSRNEMYDEKVFTRILGIPRRKPDENITDQHKDLAASLQQVITEIILGLALKARDLTGKKRLVIAGGVALNGIANHAVRNSGIFEDIYVGPCPGDDGGAIGAALVASQSMPRSLRNSFLGPSETDADIEDLLRRRRIPAETRGPEQIANDLVNGKIIGICRGRMEFGPRALGNRSILANPLIPEIKKTLNAKIKYREDFRPFAPVVLLDRAHDFFVVEPGKSFSFMSEVVQVRPEKRKALGGAVHADGTARIQTVTKDEHPFLYDILKAFESLTGIPILINTSFNLRGEPIVCNAEEALSTFARCGLDALLLGEKYIVDKTWTTPATNSLSVSDFYQELPFNYHSNSQVAARRLAIEDPIKEIGPLRKLAKDRGAALNVAEIGCGTGWFINALAFHYGCHGTGYDQSPRALKQAKGVSRLLSTSDKVSFIEQDLFKLETLEKFDLVHSFGVLHSTPDPAGALRMIGKIMRPGALIHIGLYHAFGRKPLLDHFRALADAGRSEKELYEIFCDLLPTDGDETHRFSWFRDQILHPLESQHTGEELNVLLESMGFTILGHSLNNFKKVPSISELRALDKNQENIARERLRKKSFFPGFFSVLAKKETSL